MTYAWEGNDPNRTQEYPTPAEVRAMITGAGSDGFQPANRYAGDAADSDESEGQDDEVMVWLAEARSMAESRRLAQREGRCPTCGRKSECCCQGCPTCPQTKMETGKVAAAAWAAKQVALGGTDPRESI